MHHLHISGFALFCIAAFVCIFTAIILAFIQSIKADRRAAEVEMARIKRDNDALASRPVFGGGGGAGGYRSTYGGSAGGSTAGSSAYVAPAPVAPAPVYVAPAGYSGADVGLGLATGMMIGSAMNHHDTVIVHDGGGYAPAYVEPAYVEHYNPGASYDSGISFDSGPSCDSGGGIDISFGGGD